MSLHLSILHLSHQYNICYIIEPFLIISHKIKILQTEYNIARYVNKSHKNLGALGTWITLLPFNHKNPWTVLDFILSVL